LTSPASPPRSGLLAPFSIALTPGIGLADGAGLALTGLPLVALADGLTEPIPGIVMPDIEGDGLAVPVWMTLCRNVAEAVLCVI
jgi:hypothetical protein